MSAQRGEVGVGLVRVHGIDSVIAIDVVDEGDVDCCEAEETCGFAVSNCRRLDTIARSIWEYLQGGGLKFVLGVEFHPLGLSSTDTQSSKSRVHHGEIVYLQQSVVFAPRPVHAK